MISNIGQISRSFLLTSANTPPTEVSLTTLANIGTTVVNKKFVFNAANSETNQQICNLFSALNQASQLTLSNKPGLESMTTAYITLSTFLSFKEPFSIENYNKLFFEEVVKFGAQKGFLINLGIQARKDYSAYTFYPLEPLVGIIISKEAKEFETISGDSVSRDVLTIQRASLNKSPLKANVTIGESGYGNILIYPEGVNSRGINDYHLAYQLFGSNYSDFIPLDTNIEKILAGRVHYSTENKLIMALSFSSYKLAEKLLRDVEIQQKVRLSTEYHEAQHESDKEEEKYLSLSKAKLEDQTKTNCLLELRAKANQLRPRFKEVLIMRLLKAASCAKQISVQEQESIADLIIFNKLVSSILLQPEKFGININHSSGTTPLMQIYGQFYKLADANVDLISEILPIANMEPDDFYKRYNTKDQHILVQLDPFRVKS